MIFLFIVLVLLIIVIVSALLINIFKKKDKKYYYIDDDWYEVFDLNGDGSHIAYLLACINRFNVDFFKHLHRKYNNKSTHAAKVVKTLLNNYNPNRIKDIIPSIYNKATAFVINKGEEYGICTRNVNGNAHKLDTLLFVNIHELSHLSIPDIEHTDLFWNVFKLYLTEAKEMTGRVIMTESNYCGLDVHYNPLWDRSLVMFDNPTKY